jgi:PPOX class probable F420-dependent enzyme
MDAWTRFGRARVARLGTIGAAGRPQLVPCCFALDGLVAYSAVDDKPKRTARLQRLTNVAAHPVATLLVDQYDEDWTALWWITASGPARVVSEGINEHDRAVALLLAKYAQYLDHRLDGPVLAVALERWRTWSADTFVFS